MDLHENQLKLIKFLNEVDSLEDYSLWDIARETGLKNAQTVSHHLKQLEKYGYLRRPLHNPNQFEILKSPIEDITYINQYGFAQCGNEAEFFGNNNLVERIGVSTKMFGISNPKNSFLIKAKGKSMEPYINDGDLVLFRKQNDITTSGEIALVLDDDSPKIKRLVKDTAKGYVLISLNPAFPAKEVKRNSDFAVIGIAKGVIRGL